MVLLLHVHDQVGLHLLQSILHILHQLLLLVQSAVHHLQLLFSGLDVSFVLLLLLLLLLVEQMLLDVFLDCLELLLHLSLHLVFKGGS